MTPDGLAGGLETLELLSGIVFGADETTAALPRGDGDPLAALERALIPSLESPPCGVAFSGGRDSSAVLAVASEVARRHGLPEPVPITLRFPGVEHTEETAYQESVVRHVGASEWERLEPGGALDVLGDVATGLTLRHGSLYPGNIHFLVPMLDCVGGGTLLTGLGGDEILSGNEHHAVAAMLAGRRRPTRTALRLLAKRYVAPHRDRGRLAGQLTEHFRWMSPETRAELVGRVLEDETRDRSRLPGSSDGAPTGSATCTGPGPISAGWLPTGEWPSPTRCSTPASWPGWRTGSGSSGSPPELR